jgi:hypothetical protein
MKKFLLSILLILSASLFTASADKAPLEFISLSVQIFPARTEDSIGFSWNIALSSVGDVSTVNNELMLATQDHGFSHEGFFVFENDFEFEPFLVPFVLDVPQFADVNDNGIDDFYEVAIPVEGVRTQGQHPDANNRPVNFTATWTRLAGESSGTVVLNFPNLGLTFQNSFQLLRYAGDFSFDRTNNILQGSLSLTNVLDLQDTITGPLSVRILNTNTLSYSASTWSNSAPATITISTNLDLGLSRTNFVSYWLLEDGYAPTSDSDYVDWILVVSSADANGNGQLDLVEGTTPAERPRLEVIKLPNGSLQITVRGTPGQTYTLESVNAIGGTWQTSQSIPLINETQTITVSASGSRRFFRLRQ